MRVLCRLLCLALVTMGSAGFAQSEPGSEEDRINLWPLLYKQGGQLSILGPVFSQSDDNLSVRPLFAVNTADGKRIRILYPLCELNPGSYPNWVGPFWWGDDYRVLFPLFWHMGEPFEPGGKGLSALIPFYWQRRDGENRSLWAPWPLVRNTQWNGTHSWWAGPFVGGIEGAEGSYDFVLWPLYARWATTDGRTSGDYVLPLYARTSNPDGQQFYSLPWSYGVSADGTSDWQVLFPLYYREKTEDLSRFYSLLYAAQEGPGDDRWKAIIPLCFIRDRGDSHLFATLLGGRRQDADGEAWMIYPLLTWSERKGNEYNFWALAPLIRSSRGPYGRKIHVVPIYYRNPETGTFLSLPWCRSEKDDESFTAIPPLLSWQKRHGPERDLWVGAGLFHRRWGGDPANKASHLLPVYYGEGEDTFLTPLYGRGEWGGVRRKYYCTPLSGVYTGNHTGSWLFPFYSRKVDKPTGDVSGLFLWGTHFRESTRSGKTLWPLYRSRRETNHPIPGGVRNSWLVRAGLLFHSDRTETKDVGGATDEQYHRHGLWPLYSSMNRETGDRVEQKRSFLWLLSRSRRTEEPGHQSVRHSVLWKLWDYQRDDNAVSIDSFPGITYDRQDDGSTHFSLLWRLYRKETAANGKTKLDVLFIPLKR